MVDENFVCLNFSSTEAEKACNDRQQKRIRVDCFDGDWRKIKCPRFGG